LSFSRDGKAVLIVGPFGGTARLWDAETGRPRGRHLHFKAQIHDMAFSPDGRTIMTAGNSGGMQLWDAATGRPIGKALWVPRGQITNGVCAVFSPDSRTLLARTAFVEPRPGPQGDLPFDEARLFEVPQPVEGDAVRLRLWVEVITARELDAGGEIAALDARTWHGRYAQLHKLGGPP
jgi:hypothetical protein